MNIDKNEFRKFAAGHCYVKTQSLDNYIAAIENSNLPIAQTPYITEERELRVAQIDIFSRLMMYQIIFLGNAVDDNVANIIQAQLLFLQSTDPKKDIQMYINCPGGSVYAGYGIYNTMQLISPDVAIICTGLAASMASVLLCAGAACKRAALTHSRVMLHQPLGGVQEPASDIKITARELLRVKKNYTPSSPNTVDRNTKQSTMYQTATFGW